MLNAPPKIDDTMLMPRSLTEPEVTASATEAKKLPGRWLAETEETEDGQHYVGLVAPAHDKRAFQVLLSGLQDGGVVAADWTGRVLATGVGMTEAFQAIRAALPSSGRRTRH